MKGLGLKKMGKRICFGSTARCHLTHEAEAREITMKACQAELSPTVLGEMAKPSRETWLAHSQKHYVKSLMIVFVFNYILGVS